MNTVLLIVPVDVEYPALPSTVDWIEAVEFILRLKPQVFSSNLYNQNSPLSKGDMVPLGDTGFARFLGWRGEKTPTFALRSPGQPASRMGRLRLTDADSLFGTERETTVSQLLLCPKC